MYIDFYSFQSLHECVYLSKKYKYVIGYHKLIFPKTASIKPHNYLKSQNSNIKITVGIYINKKK